MGIIYRNKDFIDNNNMYIFFCMAIPGNGVLHAHEFWELTYVYEGQGMNCTDSGTYPVDNGEIIFIKPGASHAFTLPDGGKCGDVKMLNFLFTEEYFSQLKNTVFCETDGYALAEMMQADEPFCIHLANDTAKNVKKLMWLLEYEFNHFTDGSRAVIDNLTVSLLITITRLYEYTKKSPPVSKNAEIERLIKYINSNFGQKLTLSFLADYIHLSREYLSRYFKQYTGKNLSEYLLEVRMSHAKELLEIREYSISDICAYCGYPTLSNFQRAFKNYTGLSPSQYRKHSKENLR